MKILKTGLLNAVLTCCLLQAAAQNQISSATEPGIGKPKLFTNLPQQIKLQPAGLESLLEFAVGSFVQAKVADNFTFQGIVVSKASDKEVQTVVVKSSGMQGATLTFTKALQANGQYTYSGRIISLQHGDAYEITKQNTTYILQKKKLSDLISE